MSCVHTVRRDFDMADDQIREWIAQMPLEEKIAQLYGMRIQDLMENGKISRSMPQKRSR